MPFGNGVFFVIRPEKPLDRFFKAVGLSKEFQTGDAAFDHAAYIACDHPHFQSFLQGNHAARAQLRAAVATGSKVVSDGKTLWLERSSNHPPEQADISQLGALRANLVGLRRVLPSRFAEALYWKTLLIQGVAWAVGAYAVGAVIFLWIPIQVEDHYVRASDIVLRGLALTFAVWVGLFLIIRLWLRGSSIAHNALVESIAVLVLALPPASIMAVFELNRSLDHSVPSVVRGQIRSLEEVRRRKRPDSYRLHFEENRDAPLPEHIDVGYQVFLDAGPGRIAEVEIGSGWLGAPWYRHVKIRTRQH